jgi:hypothetical protein
MKTVNYFGLELQVPNNTTAIAMEGSCNNYNIFAYLEEDPCYIVWDTTVKGWIGKNFEYICSGYRGLVKPSKSKVEV